MAIQRDVSIWRGREFTLPMLLRGVDGAALRLTDRVLRVRILWGGGSMEKFSPFDGVTILNEDTGSALLTLTAAETASIPTNAGAQYVIDVITADVPVSVQYGMMAAPRWAIDLYDSDGEVIAIETPVVQIAVTNDAFLIPPIVVEVGTPGKSAYEVAVESGFVGTQEEWIETITGDPTHRPVFIQADEPSHPGPYFWIKMDNGETSLIVKDGL